MDAALTQTFAAWIAILGAAAFLGWRAWRTFGRARHAATKGGSCGVACGCSEDPPERPAQPGS